MGLVLVHSNLQKNLSILALSVSFPDTVRKMLKEKFHDPWDLLELFQAELLSWCN